MVKSSNKQISKKQAIKTSSHRKFTKLRPVSLTEKKFLPNGRITQEEGVCEYGLEILSDEIETKETPTKGKGLFAKRKLEIGTSIPYIAEKKHDHIADINKQYMVESEKDDYVWDGNPNSSYISSHYHQVNERMKTLIKMTCIGNYVNHAHRRDANAIIFSSESYKFTMNKQCSPAYRLFPNHLNLSLWVVITKPVKKNEEIRLDYGWSESMKATYNIIE